MKWSVFEGRGAHQQRADITARDYGCGQLRGSCVSGAQLVTLANIHIPVFLV